MPDRYSQLYNDPSLNTVVPQWAAASTSTSTLVPVSLSDWPPTVDPRASVSIEGPFSLDIPENVKDKLGEKEKKARENILIMLSVSSKIAEVSSMVFGDPLIGAVVGGVQSLLEVALVCPDRLCTH